jgi:hypothetical protein
MRPTAVLASALVRSATVLTAVCSSRRWLGIRGVCGDLQTGGIDGCGMGRYGDGCGMGRYGDED